MNNENTNDLNNESSADNHRKLASVQKIDGLVPIEGADRIELAKILGWQCVVKKGEFEVGSPCIYFEIDSVLPQSQEWSLFMEKYKYRIKTIKMKGVLSQGLALPMSILADSNRAFQVGDDVTEILNVKKYEPPADNSTGTQATRAKRIKTFPGFLVKTDAFRIQSYPKCFEALRNEQVRISLKMDGQSGTFYLRNDEFGVASRNNVLSNEIPNSWWEMAKKYNVEEKLRSYGKNIAIQFEQIGPGIQKNRAGIPEIDMAVFDVFDIDQQRYYNHDEFVEICKRFEIPTVKILYVGPFNFNTIDELLDYASEQNYQNNLPAEGVVVVRCDRGPIPHLEERQNALKAISNRFLLKYGG